MTDHSGNSTGPISKKQLLAEMQSEQAAWLALLDEIGEENMTQPEAASGWSIKDIGAHLTGWRRRTVLRFRDEQLNDPQRFPWREGERLTGAFLFGHFHQEHEPDMRAWLSRVKQTR
jgi:hypothetical protein